MSNMTYTSLVEDIVGYAERPNDAKLLEQIPRLVMLAENVIAADLKTLGIKKVVTANFEPGNNIVVKPAYWRKTTTLDVSVDGMRTPILPRNYEYCRTYSPDESVQGAPRFYADYDYNHILVVPTPDKAYAFELSYEAKNDPLSAQNSTNWITYNAPHTLLYCCMRETSRYLKNPDKVQEWDMAYQQSLQGLGKEDVARISDDSSVIQ